jgi:hypothetical protein
MFLDSGRQDAWLLLAAEFQQDRARFVVADFGSAPIDGQGSWLVHGRQVLNLHLESQRPHLDALTPAQVVLFQDRLAIEQRSVGTAQVADTNPPVVKDQGAMLVADQYARWPEVASFISANQEREARHRYGFPVRLPGAQYDQAQFHGTRLML